MGPGFSQRMGMMSEQHGELTFITVPEDIPARYHDDWRLVRACVQGDRARWMELLERYEATVFFAIQHTLRVHGHRPGEDDLLDLQADLFTRLVRDDFRKLSQYSGRCKLSHWLKVVANHHAIDFLRHQRPTVSLDADTDSARALRHQLVNREPTAADRLLRQQQRDAFEALIKFLPAADQQFLHLHIRDELSFEAIAEVMETTVGAVYARKNRVRKKLIALAREHNYL